MGEIFCEEFLRGIFGRHLMGELFLEDYSERNFFGGIFWEDFEDFFLHCKSQLRDLSSLSRFWFLSRFLVNGERKEGEF